MHVLTRRQNDDVIQVKVSEVIQRLAFIMAGRMTNVNVFNTPGRPSPSAYRDKYRQIVKNVVDFNKSEAQRGKLYVAISRPLERTEQMLKLSRRQVSRILTGENGPSSSSSANTPSSNTPPQKPRKYDNFDREMIRRTLVDLYSKGEAVTVKKLKETIWPAAETGPSTATVQRVLKESGYKFKKRGLDLLVRETFQIVAKRRR